MTNANETTSRTVIQVSTDESGHLESRGLIFRIANANRAGGPGGWGIGGWDETGSGRLVCGGPLVSGPVAYFYGLASVLDNRGGTRAIHESADESGRLFDVSAGDTVVINGIAFVVSLDSRGYPSLKRAS